MIALAALAALPLFVIGVFQVSDGNDAGLPLLISGVIMLTALEWIPHDRW